MSNSKDATETERERHREQIQNSAREREREREERAGWGMTPLVTEGPPHFVRASELWTTKREIAGRTFLFRASDRLDQRGKEHE